MRVRFWLSKLVRRICKAHTWLYILLRRRTSTCLLTAVFLVQPIASSVDGDDWFEPAVYYPAASRPSQSITGADFNLDGTTDLVVVNHFGFFDPDTFGEVGVLLGMGDGLFGLPLKVTDYWVECAWGLNVVASDFNGDALPDLAIVAGQRVVEVYMGNGDGTFADVIRLPFCTEGCGFFGSGHGIVAADFDGDGFKDIAVSMHAGCLTVYALEVVVLRGKGDGTFHPDQAHVVGKNPQR